MQHFLLGQQVKRKKSSFYYNYQYSSFQLLSFCEVLTALYNENFSTFYHYLRIAIFPESTQTANAAISTAPTGKKTKSNEISLTLSFSCFFPEYREYKMFIFGNCFNLYSEVL